MQLSKDSNLIDWSTRLAMYIFCKIKALAWHIVKHPLGSIFWVVKAYFALMFLSLFVACSFGAFAQVPDETKPAKSQKLITCEARYPLGGPIVGNASGATFSECASKATESITSKIEYPKSSETIDNFPSKKTITRTFSPIPCRGDSDCQVGIKVSVIESESICYAKDGAMQCDAKDPQYGSYNILGHIRGIAQVDGFICPPDGFPEFTLGPDASNLCRKPISDAKKCWPAGGDWEFAPQYFFTHGSSSMQSICALKDDTSGQRCPWKKVGTGVYVPDPTSTRNCTDDPNPPEPPAPKPDPAQCKTGGNGLKVCDSNPNEKCTANSTGALSCTAKCGYVNNNFFCFDNPKDKPNDPSIPDKDPLKPVDDLIADATKSINDMTKGDFKSILKGTDGRLDNLLTEMQNGNKTTEAQLGKLLEKEGTGDFTKAEGLLTSIDENINSINDALTKTGDNPTLEKPEFDEDTNNWKTRNFGTILKDSSKQILELPLFKSVEKFFNVSFGGSCPSYSVSVWVYEITIDQFCSPQVESLWPYIKAVVLLLSSFLAIRIALL